MKVLKITNEEFEAISNLLDGYISDLSELDKSSKEYDSLKWKLDNNFCELNIFQEQQIIHNELDIGNTYIVDDILTCIYDNEIHKFRLVDRPAKNGEYVFIIAATECTPFNKKYLNRCFKVDKQPTKEMLEWVCDHVGVNIEGLDVGWCLYNDQYLVLENI